MNEELVNRLVKFAQENVGLLVSIGLDQQKISAKIVNIFLLINFNKCFGYSKEQSH